MFVRSRKLKLLQSISGDALKFSYKYGNDSWINHEKYESCMNDILVDELILFMLSLYGRDALILLIYPEWIAYEITLADRFCLLL